MNLKIKENNTMKNDVTTVEDEVMNDQNEDSAMANLMAFMNMGVVEVEDEDSDVDDMDDVLDFDDEDESELPSKNAGRKRAGGKRKKAEDDDKSDGEDLIEKGISFTDSQNYRDSLGAKEGYTYRMSHVPSRQFIYAMREKLMEAGMSLEDIVKYVKFYFFSWQGDFYVSAIYNSYFNKLTVKREKQSDDAFEEKVQKHDSLEEIFDSVLGNMDVARECGSDGRPIDMLAFQDTMIDKPSKWSIHDVR